MGRGRERGQGREFLFPTLSPPGREMREVGLGTGHWGARHVGDGQGEGPTRGHCCHCSEKEHIGVSQNVGPILRRKHGMNCGQLGRTGTCF